MDVEYNFYFSKCFFFFNAWWNFGTKLFFKTLKDFWISIFIWLFVWFQWSFINFYLGFAPMTELYFPLLNQYHYLLFLHFVQATLLSNEIFKLWHGNTRINRQRKRDHGLDITSFPISYDACSFSRRFTDHGLRQIITAGRCENLPSLKWMAKSAFDINIIQYEFFICDWENCASRVSFIFFILVL